MLESSVYSSHDFDRYADARQRSKPDTNALTVKVCGDETLPSCRCVSPTSAASPTRARSARTSSRRARLPPSSPRASLVRRKAPCQGEGTEEARRKAQAEGGNREARSESQAGEGTEDPLRETRRRRRSGAGLRAADEQEGRERADLEAYARYLYETDGDDPAEHLARDLAHRAAEKQPTVRRCLLAAALAEDHNQRGDWIKKAEALAKGTPEPRGAARARAAPPRKPRASTKRFRSSIGCSPLTRTTSTALQGRVELYNMAGLPRTALATLERALERNPRRRQSPEPLRVAAARARPHHRGGRGRGALLEPALRRRRVPRPDARACDRAARQAGRRALGRAPARIAPGRSLGARRGGARVPRARRDRARRRDLPARARARARRRRHAAHARRPLRRARQADEQLRLLREILRIRPQDKSVREYVEHLEPKEPRADEAYAWAPERFLPLRHAPARAKTAARCAISRSRPCSRTASRASSARSCSSRSPTPAAADARQYAFVYEADRQVVQLRGAQGVPRRRAHRRGHRVRRRARRRPVDRHVHVGAHLLRAVPAARAGRRGRAPLPRRRRDAAQRVRRLLRRDRVPAGQRAGARTPSTC